jgi:ribonuclease R
MKKRFRSRKPPKSKRHFTRSPRPERDLPTNVVGQIQILQDGRAVVLPFGREVQNPLFLLPEATHPKWNAEQVIAVRLDREKSKHGKHYAKFIRTLGSMNDPQIDSKIVVHRHELPTQFPNEAIQEAQKIHRQPPPPGHRTDLRHIPFVTIDGADAKDHDDAVALDKHGNLWVAIADVAHYVRVGSALDQEACARGNSYYFPDSVLPMLPEILSNDLCSLKPEVDRLVLAVKMVLTSEGRLKDWQIVEGVIHSKARLTYEGVDAEFQNGKVDPMLQQMRNLADVVYRSRVKDGGIDFDLSEAKVVLNEHGGVEAMARRERTPSQRIIEEFMLLANKAVATELNRSGREAVYRIHDKPDSKKLEIFFELVRSQGIRCNLKASDGDPNKMGKVLVEISKSEKRKIFSYLALRTMSQAYYSTHNIGHYGLGFPLYVHFTSPIRRYADLLIHREVKRLLQHDRNKSEIFPRYFQSLENVCLHISQCERTAQLAEREIRSIKATRFLSERIGSKFRSMIVGVIKHGFFVELDEHAVEGFVPLFQLPRDRYVFNERELTLKGLRRKKIYRVGDRLSVRANKADLPMFRVDFSLA